jgi:chromosome segregation ATPase
MILRKVLVVVMIAFAIAYSPFTRAADVKRLGDLGPQHPEVVRAKEQAEREVNRALATLDQARQMYQKLQNELRDRTGRIDVAPESLRRAAARLETELESLQLDAAGGAARTKALEATIAEVAARGQDAAKRDEVAAEYEKVASAREQALKNAEALAAQKTISLQELENARATLAEAKARLAERRINAVAAAGGGALAEWNRELLNLSLDAQERRARMAFLKDSLERIRQGLPMLDQMQELEEALPAARRGVAEARRAMDDLEREISNAPIPGEKTPIKEEERGKGKP